MTWYLIIVTTLLVSILQVLLRLKPNFKATMFLGMIFRRFLCQDDSLPGKFLKLDVIRQIFIGIDLALIVLLNAYKSDNIVKIVNPREIMPYQIVEQLVEDGYTAYSRIGYIS